MTATHIAVQQADFELANEYRALRGDDRECGAIVTFSGLVRDFHPGDDSQVMHLEHYPGMTEKSLQNICTQARERWSVGAIRVIHRVGALRPGDQIVFVGVAGRHRREAFQACEFIMDFLKTRAPFWKKEVTRAGGHWVDARDSDDHAAERWQR